MDSRRALVARRRPRAVRLHRKAMAGRARKTTGGSRGEFPRATGRLAPARREPAAARRARGGARRREGPAARGRPADGSMGRGWVFLLAYAALPAAAHQQGVSLAEGNVEADRATVRLRFAGADLAALLHLEQAPDGAYTQSGLDAVRPALVNLTLDEYLLS